MREWNTIPDEAKQIGSLVTFKAFLNRDKKKVPKYYTIGKRKLQILHTRLRTNCSSLNSDLFRKKYDRVSCMYTCTCGTVENAYHFFFVCNRYNIERRTLMDSLLDVPNLNLRKLLYGDEKLSYPINVRIFFGSTEIH